MAVLPTERHCIRAESQLLYINIYCFAGFAQAVLVPSQGFFFLAAFFSDPRVRPHCTPSCVAFKVDTTRRLVMAIEALYPSRRQSQRNNPLFARERRLRQLGLALMIGAGFLSFLALRAGPAGASPEAIPKTIPMASQTALTAPFAPRRIASANTADGPSVTRPHKHVRVIPLFTVPADAAAVAPRHGQEG
jgi:hypothetical protein